MTTHQEDFDFPFHGRHFEELTLLIIPAAFIIISACTSFLFQTNGDTKEPYRTEAQNCNHLHYYSLVDHQLVSASLLNLIIIIQLLTRTLTNFKCVGSSGLLLPVSNQSKLLLLPSVSCCQFSNCVITQGKFLSPYCSC